ncbi:MAG: hypothetical protein MZU84_09210 [Sphingobacterium sp.]|nr:hypothetical protein [Sphingobacterium sp.]
MEERAISTGPSRNTGKPLTIDPSNQVRYLMSPLPLPARPRARRERRPGRGRAEYAKFLGGLEGRLRSLPPRAHRTLRRRLAARADTSVPPCYRPRRRPFRLIPQGGPS